jgi:hypothetical protein
LQVAGWEAPVALQPWVPPPGIYQQFVDAKGGYKLVYTGRQESGITCQWSVKAKEKAQPQWLGRSGTLTYYFNCSELTKTKRPVFGIYYLVCFVDCGRVLQRLRGLTGKLEVAGCRLSVEAKARATTEILSGAQNDEREGMRAGGECGREGMRAGGECGRGR